MLPLIPRRVVPFHLLTVWLGYNYVCWKFYLSTEWVPTCLGLFGKQGLRKEPVCNKFYFILFERVFSLNVALWVCWDELFLCFFGKQPFEPAFPRLSDLEVFVAYLAEQNVFFDTKPFFGFPLWCKKSMLGGRSFFGPAQPFCWEDHLFVLPASVGRGKKNPHFRGHACCCGGLSCVLASARDPGHDAEHVTSTITGVAKLVFESWSETMGMDVRSVKVLEAQPGVHRSCTSNTCHFYRA